MEPEEVPAWLGIESSRGGGAGMALSAQQMTCGLECGVAGHLGVGGT